MTSNHCKPKCPCLRAVRFSLTLRTHGSVQSYPRLKLRGGGKKKKKLILHGCLVRGADQNRTHVRTFLYFQTIENRAVLLSILCCTLMERIVWGIFTPLIEPHTRQGGATDATMGAQGVAPPGGSGNTYNSKDLRLYLTLLWCHSLFPYAVCRGQSMCRSDKYKPRRGCGKVFGLDTLPSFQ